jgi:hypothetical protein
MRNHQLIRAVVSAFVMTSNVAGFACDCGAPAPACAYISAAPVVFVGTPVYSNDDGSGTFLQQTLYKFTIDEIFKGLPEGTKEVWVDPGSFTSCYAEYEIGTKLLVFASEGKLIPVDTAAMTVAKPAGKQKPLPPGFDPKKRVYYAPECTGTRDAATAADDIAWLRSWKKGYTQTRIQGLVFDALDWPLSGVKVTATGHTGNVEATTDATGAFSIEPVEPGEYDLKATLASYDLPWKPKVAVLEHSCGYAKLSMGSTGALSGAVKDESGRPLAGVELDLARMRGSEETFPSMPHVTSKAGGSFRYEDLPGGDYLIGVNLDSQPNVDTPYARTYAPGVSDRGQAQVFHLVPGQKLSNIRIQLAPRLRLRTIHVQVRWPDGSSVGEGVSVTADDTKDSITDIEETKKDGSASVQCFAAKGCMIEAKNWITTPGQGAIPQLAASLPSRVEAGNASLTIKLILSEKRTDWEKP